MSFDDSFDDSALKNLLSKPAKQLWSQVLHLCKDGGAQQNHRRTHLKAAFTD